MNQNNKTRSMVLASIFVAIIIIMAFTPFGYVPLGFMNTTIIQVPVIIGAILLGPRYGGFLGLTFGITSLCKNTFMPNPTSFVFSPFVKVGPYGGNFGSLIIAIVPRILIAVSAYYVFRIMLKLLKENRKKRVIALAVAGAAGSLTNTILVISLIYLLFGKEYSQVAKSVANGVLLSSTAGIICVTGIFEALFSAIFAVAVTQALFKVMNR